eukprot:TRINITY_DN18256_c0_g1_i1.p1 TRINITY_DN18256_c0_g1~~TRINITY_DN18256_c0_g1_i1.p1  ORF type:complete len:849 (+),score=311.31 TRINITY_DN18256_c0_g1_i1:45-2591(+)
MAAAAAAAPAKVASPGKMKSRAAAAPPIVVPAARVASPGSPTHLSPRASPAASPALGGRRPLVSGSPRGSPRNSPRGSPHASPATSPRATKSTRGGRCAIRQPDRVTAAEDCTVAKAQELRAFAVAFELEGEPARCLRCYKDEGRVWRQLLAAADPEDHDTLRAHVLELARASEGLARCWGVMDNEAKVVETNRSALQVAAAVLDGNHPMIAGMKAHLGDSAIIFAKQCERARVSLLAEPEATNFDQNESELWRKRILSATQQRNDFADEAYEHYADAIMTFRVCAGLRGGEVERPPLQAAAAAGPVCDDEDLNGPFGSHVAHCLAKISEGFLISERDELALDFSTRAEQQYWLYCDAYDSLAPHASKESSVVGRGGTWDLGMPYLQGYDYDPAQLPHITEAAPLPEAMGSHVEETLRKIGGVLDRSLMRNAYDTWTPSTDEVVDLLQKPEAVAPALAAAREVAHAFLDAINAKNPRWIHLLREHPLLAYLGVVDVGAAGADDALPGLADALVLVESPVVEYVLEHIPQKLHHYPHLCCFSDLMPAEIARCHGLDWRRSPIGFRLPLLTAVRIKNTEAIDMLVSFDVNANAVSPHDMMNALGAAVDVGDVAIMKRLLQLDSILLEDGDGHVELEATRHPLTMSTTVKEVPLAPAKARRFGGKAGHAMPQEQLWELIMCQPEHKVRQWYYERVDLFFELLGKDPDATEHCLAAFRGPLAGFAPSALKHALDRKLEPVYTPLLTLVTQNDKIELIATTADLLTATLLVEDVHPNTMYHGRPVVAYHLAKHHREIARYMSGRFSIDEQLLQPAEVEFLDQVVDKWGTCLLSDPAGSPKARPRPGPESGAAR